MSGWGVVTEYAPLSSVLLYRPGIELANHPEPAAIQHLAPIDHSSLMREFDAIITTYLALGITVNLIDDTPITADQSYRYNMMYCRDLFFMTPQGVIMANMANDTRSLEPVYAARMLQSLGIPLLHTVSGVGRFEAADAIWLREDLVLMGVGNRTNRQGYEQVATILAKFGISSVSVPSFQTYTQHLLGTLQVVDRTLALVRHEIADASITSLLEEQGFTVICIPEHWEVRMRQAMNIVTVAPRSIIMTNGCPVTKEHYLNAGLTVVAELELTQMMAGAGGLACATGIICRKDHVGISEKNMFRA